MAVRLHGRRHRLRGDVFGEFRGGDLCRPDGHAGRELDLHGLVRGLRRDVGTVHDHDERRANSDGDFRAGGLSLTVATSGSGTGTVSSSPAGINCGTSCTAGFPNGSQVTLSAVPSTNATFSGWSGDCSGTAPTCTVTMTSARSTTATFALATYPLSVARSGTGLGTVTSAPSGIDCGVTCTASFSWGTGVTLTAAPAAGSMFSGWSGDCVGTASTCTVTMTSARSTTATFQPIPLTYRPDEWIKLHAATSYVGDGVYGSTGTGETVSVTIARGTSQTFDIAIQNDGSVADTFLVKGGGSTSRMQVKYYSGLTGTTDITSLVTSGGYSTSSLVSGASAFIRLVVTVKSATPTGTVQSWLVTPRRKHSRRTWTP
jgi:Divergent InlB B-repeat domain